MLGNAISVEFGNAISVEGAPWKVRPGRYALEGALPEAPGPGGSLPKSRPVPESPLETRRRYGRRARKRRTWRNPALPGRDG